jgi:hypothetical protein
MKGVKNLSLGQTLFQVMKIHAYTDGSLLIIHWNGIGYRFIQGNRVDEAIITQFLYHYLNIKGLMGIDISKTLSNRISIQVSFDLMFENSRVDS